MNKENQRKQLEKMLRKCPEILTPSKARKWTPIGRNTLYEAVKNGEIESYIYKGGYIFTKDALIDYMLRNTDEVGRTFAVAGEQDDK